MKLITGKINGHGSGITGVDMRILRGPSGGLT
jgi:hypothetical protein